MTWPEIFQGIVGIVVMILVYFVSAWLAAKKKADEASGQVSKTTLLEILASIAVGYAEQKGKADLLIPNSQKYEMAADKLLSLLSQHGMSIDKEMMKPLIEAAVQRMNATRASPTE